MVSEQPDNGYSACRKKTAALHVCPFHHLCVLNIKKIINDQKSNNSLCNNNYCYWLVITWCGWKKPFFSPQDGKFPVSHICLTFHFNFKLHVYQKECIKTGNLSEGMFWGSFKFCFSRQYSKIIFYCHSFFFFLRVNCSFYFKIGACRHGDRCSRLHNKPTFSQVRSSFFFSA